MSNSLVLCREWKQLKLSASLGEYVTDGWNLCDLGGNLSLYVYISSESEL